ncbi:MAG: SH3 domain-containing protein [Oscillospiraceae bacterium]|nr:SH3 domain-containing protein [Oscillospiraceae bacterium]
MAKKKNTPQLTGVVINGDLNIREQPSKSAAILGVLKDGSAVKIIAPHDDFYQIPEGYVMKQFIQVDEIMPAPAEAKK